MRGRVEWLTVDSVALKNNAGKEPALRRFPVYLPPSHGQGTERFPTVYLLHAFGSAGASWTNHNGFTPNTLERLDRLIEAGTVPPAIAVCPDGWTRLGGSQWINSAGTGRYADYLAQDVVKAVDGSFRTDPRPRSRALIGTSSGGYGALAVTRAQPGLFDHLACHSGDAFFEYCYLPDFPKAAGALMDGGGVSNWFEGFRRRARETQLRGNDHLVLNTLAMAAAYSPRAGAPLELELPFDASSARILPQVWSRWLEHDPVRFILENGRAFAGLRSAFIDCGTQDEFNLRWGARQVAEALIGVGAPVVHEEFPDGHRGIGYRHERSLGYLLPRMVDASSTT